MFSEVPQIQAGASPWTPLLNFRPRPPDSLENFGSNQWSPLKAQPQTIVAVAECPFPLNFRLEPPKTGVPNLGCRHPLGCQTQIQGCQTRFRGVMQNSKFGAPHRLSQIWILINYDGRVSNQLGLTDGYCARTRLGILGLKRYVVVWFCLLLLELPCARIKLNVNREKVDSVIKQSEITTQLYVRLLRVIRPVALVTRVIWCIRNMHFTPTVLYSNICNRKTCNSFYRFLPCHNYDYKLL